MINPNLSSSFACQDENLLSDDEINSIIDEAVPLLQSLIRIKTVNPPGDEEPAAVFLNALLKNNHIETEIIPTAPSRANVIARIPGTGMKQPVLLNSHLDVVPVSGQNWSVDPFQAEIIDGFIWGRGAMDCKYRVTVHTMLMLLIKRKQIRLNRDLIFLASCDEEMGGRFGLKYIADHYPEKIRSEYVLGEGGGGSVPANNGLCFTVGTSERGSYKVTITIKGSTGHTSLVIKETAMEHLRKVLEAFSDPYIHFHLNESARKTIEILAQTEETEVKAALNALLDPDSFWSGFERLRHASPSLAQWLETTMFTTIVPTGVDSGASSHVHPANITLTCNLRTLPGVSEETIFSKVRERLAGIPELEIKFDSETEASESPFDTDLYKVIEKIYSEELPGAKLVPWVLSGSTDIRYLRKINSIAYGFFPSVMDLPFEVWNSLTHGADERISINNLRWGIKILFKILMEINKL